MGTREFLGTWGMGGDLTPEHASELKQALIGHRIVDVDPLVQYGDLQAVTFTLDNSVRVRFLPETEWGDRDAQGVDIFLQNDAM